MSDTKSFIVAVCTAVCMAGVSQAQADAALHARKAVQAAYDARDRAMAHKDVRGTLACIAPDFISTTLDGQQHTYTRQGLSMMFSFVRAMSLQTTIRQFAIQGNEVADIVETRNAITVLNPNTQKLESTTLDYTIKDVWTRQGGGWLLRRSQELTKKRVS